MQLYNDEQDNKVKALTAKCLGNIREMTWKRYGFSVASGM